MSPGLQRKSQDAICQFMIKQKPMVSTIGFGRGVEASGLGGEGGGERRGVGEVDDGPALARGSAAHEREVGAARPDAEEGDVLEAAVERGRDVTHVRVLEHDLVFEGLSFHGSHALLVQAGGLSAKGLEFILHLGHFVNHETGATSHCP
jgi:hypothetical protein